MEEVGAELDVLLLAHLLMHKKVLLDERKADYRVDVDDDRAEESDHEQRAAVARHCLEDGLQVCGLVEDVEQVEGEEERVDEQAARSEQEGGGEEEQRGVTPPG